MSDDSIDFVDPFENPQPLEPENPGSPGAGSAESRAGSSAMRQLRQNLPTLEPELPPDIEAVWGQGKLDGTGQPAIDTARALIAAWGIDRFRGSELHRQALAASESEQRRALNQRAFIDMMRRRK